MQIRSATFPAQPFFDAGLTKGWEEIYRGVQPASQPACRLDSCLHSVCSSSRPQPRVGTISDFGKRKTTFLCLVEKYGCL